VSCRGRVVARTGGEEGKKQQRGEEGDNQGLFKRKGQTTKKGSASSEGGVLTSLET